jgi:hypothetical protein
MERRTLILTMLTAATTLSIPIVAIASAKVTVPAGTQIQLVSKSTIATGAAKPGDIVDFSVNQSVVVGGWVVVPSGAAAQGHVIGGGDTKTSFNPFHPVQFTPITVQLDYVVSSDGGKIQLDSTPIEIKPQTHRVLMNQAQSPAMAEAGATFTGKTDHLVHVVANVRAAGAGYDH